MRDNRISILIPTYGEAKFLAEVLESVFQNAYSNCEIIICTQGDCYLDKHLLIDKRVKEIHLTKPSRYLSRIQLFNHSTGDYVWFVDDDDKITSQALQIINSIAQLAKPDCMVFEKIDVLNDSNPIIYTGKKSFDINRCFANYPKEKALKELICTNRYNSVCTKVFNRNIAPSWIETDIHQSEDKLLNYALYKACNTFVKVNYPIYLYYLFHGNWSRPITIERLNDSIESRKILTKLEPDYSYILLTDIFKRIEQYLTHTDASATDDRISFDEKDFSSSTIRKALFSIHFFEFKCILKKKYSLIRKKGNIINFFHDKKKMVFDWLLAEKKQRKKWLRLLIPLTCFYLISPIILFSPSSKTQDVADYITNQTEKDGFNLVSFGKKDSSSGTKPSFSTEYYALHDQFNTYSRCLETYDPLKSKGFKIDSFSDEYDGEYTSFQTSLSNNLSFLTSPGIQIEKTIEKKDGAEFEVYRNFVYKFQFNYQGLEKGDVHATHYYIYCALHQNQASELVEIINNMSDKKIDEESLIGTYIGVTSSDGQERFVFRVFNIIKSDVDYIKDYDEALGNFIFVNDNSFGQLELYNSYMMTKNSYENYYNLKTRTSIYKNINYKIMYGHDSKAEPNTVDIQKRLDEIMSINSLNTAAAITLISIDFIILACFCVFFYTTRKKTSYLDYLIAMFVPSVPYLIIKLICFFTKSSAAFSYITSLAYFVFTILYEIFMTIKILKLHYENKNSWYKNNF